MTVARDDDGDGATFGAAVTLCTAPGQVPTGFSPPSGTDDCDETNPLVTTGCSGNCTVRRFGARTFAACPGPLDRTPSANFCDNTPGVFLASIHSSDEMNFVRETLTRRGISGRVWIGLRESPARWDDGSAVDFFGFANGATQGPQAGEACVNILTSTFQWDDDDCAGHDFAFLCASRP